MAIVEMKKVTIIALKSEKLEIIDKLQEFGTLHMVDITSEADFDASKILEKFQGSTDVGQNESDLIKVKFVSDFIKRFGSLSKSKFTNKVVLTPNKVEKLLTDRDLLNELNETCLKIERELNALKSKTTKDNQNLLNLKPWKKLDENLENLVDTNHTIICAGIIPREHETIFIRSLEIQIEHLFYKFVEGDRDFAYYLIVCLKENSEPFFKLQKQVGFSRVSFNDCVGTASENIKRIETDLLDLEKRKALLEQKASELICHEAYLESIYDVLSVEVDKSEVNKNFMKSKQTFVMCAWIPIELIGELETRLKSITESFSLSFASEQAGEVSPTLLKNHRYARPLEFITEQYSVPSSKGIDPNPVMAPFFILFFGIMVSDAIYGLIIVSIAAFILNKSKPTGNFKKILGILFLGGISTAFWGTMFGGWFGGLITLSPVLFDPLQEPFKMIALCIAFGIIHLFVGFGLQAYMNIKRGFILDALLDQGLWVSFILSIMSLALPGLAPYNKYAAIAFAIGLVLTQGRRKTNPIMKLLSGILSLYNITGFLGDVLSYLRLFALGLATGVIGTVINSMALMLKGSVIGFLVMIVILIFGHTFNIAINVLGAYVHSSRLQYVEFFSKFYEGDGIKYNPFRIKTKYVTINSIYENKEATK